MAGKGSARIAALLEAITKFPYAQAVELAGKTAVTFKGVEGRRAFVSTPKMVHQLLPKDIEVHYGTSKPDEEGKVHTMPLFGRVHVATVYCWCLPTEDGQDDEGRVQVSHYAEQ